MMFRNVPFQFWAKKFPPPKPKTRNADDWYPSPCRHSVRPHVEQEWIDVGMGVLGDKMPGRRSLWYDCPTPTECGQTAYEELHNWLTAPT